MRDWKKRLCLLFVFLQFSVPLLAEQQVLQDDADSTLGADGKPKPSIAAQSPTPQKPVGEPDDGRQRIDGSEQFEKGLFFLRKHEGTSPRPSRKPSGLVGIAGQYLLTLLPRLYISGPPTEGPQNGHRIPKQVAEGVRFLEEAAQLNNPDAIYLLAQMNFYGNFSHPRDYPEAFRRYQQLAALDGNSSAQHMVGFLYSTGFGGAVERDQAKALLYHSYAAQGGSTRSEMALAFRHHSGIGAVSNCTSAIKHYKNVADAAIRWYRSGPPGGMAYVPDSYRLADEEGGVYGEGASYSSAGVNRNKHGVSSDANADLDDVLEYLDLMSKKGDFKATFSLGRIHYEGQKGLARDHAKAKRYFMMVAKLYWERNGQIKDTDKHGLERTATKAAGYLGMIFLRGEGLEPNYEKAKIWFQRGIKSGDAGSQWGLGLMFFDGLGVERNILKAADLFKAAAEQDYAPAQVSLGSIYLDQGTSNDVAAAAKLFEYAGRYGHMEALYYLAEMMRQGVGLDRSCGLAVAYYKNVAEKAEPLLTSFAEANQAYEEGDYETALVNYMLAAEQGYEKAQTNVAYLLDQQKSKLALPKWLSISSPRPRILEDPALALMYWTRSAKQARIDSLVKMGDYYLNGIGASVDLEKAASCYTAATEYHQSAQGLYNLAWMHENGVGLNQDFHLAKRYYDLALETNEEAYLPVTLSLFKLRLRSAWNTLTHGRVNSIQDDPTPQKEWSLSEWISNFLRDDPDAMYYDNDGYDDTYLPENDPMPGGDADGLYDDFIDDGIIESLIIVGLAAVLLGLIYYRQQRAQAHQRNEGANAANAGANAPGAPQNEGGLFPQPGQPGFNDWVAGGIGH